MGGESYKVWGAALVAMTVALAIGIFINEATHTKHHDIKAYIVDVPDTTQANTEVAAKPVSSTIETIVPLLAAADATAGEKAFKRCATCHTFQKGGANKVGPNLFNVVGGSKAAIPDFAYSNALTAMGGTWSYENLNAFLTKPKDFLAGTKMTFAGVKKAQDRANIIAFLRQYSDTPFPLPAQ
ncbi:MAG: cytochrome c family protein [Alphaproteobacteria bacterium]|nr:cytochrome c family protein [Alphaproteobacteria bacterium]